MSSIKGIPVVSGAKVERDGISVIKDGIKSGNRAAASSRQRKPSWLRARAPGGAGFRQVREIVSGHGLHTVCEESYCPNMGECWSHGTATFMVLGSVCTRACQFCSVDTGNPRGRVEEDEPQRIAESVQLMGLQYAVITSVNRDDLSDGGAAHYAACVDRVKQLNPETAIEVLTPDFNGEEQDIAVVARSGLEVFAHNLETVRRLTPEVRDRRADYLQSLEVLAAAKRANGNILTKSSLMVGLGEEEEEIVSALEDMRRYDVDIATLGQYLQPTRNHLPVQRYYSPQELNSLRETGLQLGFREVVAGPLVRSSYRAERVMEQNNVGIDSSEQQK
ncbi:lipoyl synthase [Halorhodospira halochloris]|uniref:Lipoyl synthase n=1 Tax=Halorhodospira halochloris TaxID=1052 RepID=A0A120MZR1_HALHR|nr:lipoyl synthase [Halorhodospira halochloris]MBK1651273.1 lipoyl synthase [Halorhodospira halochloris]MCG5530479.1 lipoyl synthase [Halorhodospira halochloris]MCG5548605.1 lipoyl synthase [Halorhodospira halochloris]BAU57552.1 lipoate synthase [Halorhodospira halochloris]